MLLERYLNPAVSLPAASVDLEAWARFVAKMNLSIVLYFLGTIAAVIVIAVLIGLVRWWANSRQNLASQKLAYAKKHRPDSLPYPPVGRGMCDACRKAFDRVYYMPDGRRLCLQCYQLLEMSDRPDEAPQDPEPPETADQRPSI